MFDRSQNLDLVKYLLEEDAKINETPNKQNNTAIFEATLGKNSDIVRALLDHGAKCTSDVTFNNLTEFNAIVAVNNTEFVQLCIRNGANVNARNFRDVSALHLAALLGNVEMMKLLIDQVEKILFLEKKMVFSFFVFKGC